MPNPSTGDRKTKTRTPERNRPSDRDPAGREQIPVHRPYGETVSPVDSQVKSVGYDADDKEVPATDDSAVAKTVTDESTGRTTYYLKVATSGGEAGQLYNQQSPLHNPFGNTRQLGRSGLNQYVFKKVAPQAFELYRSFLRSKSLVHFRQAQRML